MNYLEHSNFKPKLDYNKSTYKKNMGKGQNPNMSKSILAPFLFFLHAVTSKCKKCTQFLPLLHWSIAKKPRDCEEQEGQDCNKALFAPSGTTNIVVANSYSGFIDYCELQAASLNEVITALKRWFATLEIPIVLESDNGTCFGAREFQKFRSKGRFNHITSSPRYPKSNG